MNDLDPILYTIRPGDTLYSLALMYGTTVQEIIDTNLSLNPYNLRVGQQIYIYILALTILMIIGLVLTKLIYYKV